MPKQFYQVGDRFYNVSHIQHITFRKDEDSGEMNAFIRLAGISDSIIYNQKESPEKYDQIKEMAQQFHQVGDRFYNASQIQHITFRKDDDSGEMNAFIRLVGISDSIIYNQKESLEKYEQIKGMAENLAK